MCLVAPEFRGVSASRVLGTVEHIPCDWLFLDSRGTAVGRASGEVVSHLTVKLEATSPFWTQPIGAPRANCKPIEESRGDISSPVRHHQPRASACVRLDEAAGRAPPRHWRMEESSPVRLPTRSSGNRMARGTSRRGVSHWRTGFTSMCRSALGLRGVQRAAHRDLGAQGKTKRSRRSSTSDDAMASRRPNCSLRHSMFRHRTYAPRLRGSHEHQPIGTPLRSGDSKEPHQLGLAGRVSMRSLAARTQRVWTNARLA